jgi:predicted amidophosphoribosyltransferase
MKATLGHCKRCGRIFPKIYNDYCPDCILKEEQNLNTIKAFLAKVPDIKNLTIEEISENTGVDISDIFLYIKKRRLLDLFNAVKLKCKICGTEIALSSKQSFLCPKCNIQVIEIIEEQEKKSENNHGKTKYGFKKYMF